MYAYAANNPVKYTDQTELAAGDPFETPDDAAKDWADTYADDSIFNQREFGSSIYYYYDENGKLIWKSGYTAFGELAGESVDKLEGVFEFHGMYTGCQIDSETGLTYHWNRWRNENGSQFITQDPARDGGNWYGYCRQNPLIYTDPDGNTITRFINQRIANAIGYLYNHSQTFQNTYKSLASETNQQGKTLFVYVTDNAAKYAGNTQTQDCPIIKSVEIQKYSNDYFYNDILQEGTDVQVVILNIDLQRVDAKNLNLLEVVAEEFVHGAEAARVGTNEWNERARLENQMPYTNRPEEIRAKNIVTKIMGELKSYEEN